MKRLHLFLSLFLLAGLSFQLAAQTEGWDLIRTNDHKAARKSFEAALQKDSLDEQALKGLLVLADMEQDNLGYRTYVRRLLNKYDDEVQFLVLENNYSGSAESILKKTTLSERAQIRSKIAQADEKEQNRKFDDAKKLRSNLFHGFSWSFLGPFKNISGSGFVNTYAPETDAWSSSRGYTNPMGATFNWVTPKYLPETGMLNAEDYCMGWGERSVYYANTFFETKTKTTIQLRVSREAPMKIWLDGSLVLEAKDELNFTWDNEIVTLELPAGTHRILVKTASAASAPRSYRFLEFEPGSGALNSRYDFSDLFDFGGMFGGGYFGNSGEHNFCIRMTDANGKLIDAAPAGGTTFTPQQYKTALTSMYALSELKKRTEKNPDDLFTWYLYSKAALDLKQTHQSEQYFVKALRKNPKLVFLKFLVARIYARNGKIEKTYETLNAIDAEKTPLFGEQYQKFEEIDLGIDPDRYFSALNKLNAITPTNYAVINAFVKYYNARGMRTEKETYLKAMMEKVPEYKESLQWELENDDNKPYKEQTDKERDKYGEEAIKRMRSNFYVYDYTTAIDYYKGKGNTKKVLQLYDELIERLPWESYYRIEKANVLYSNEKYDEALKLLDEALQISPYNAGVIETKGDIWYDKGKNNDANVQQALAYYREAHKLSKGGYNSLDEKIEKIAGQKTYKQLFATKGFEEVQNITDWKFKYPDEESVVVMYTRDIILNDQKDIEVYQQFMVKVQNETGVKRWMEYNFSFLGNVTMVKVKKPNGTEFTPDQQGGYVVIKNLEPGDLIMLEGIYTWSRYDEQLDTAFSMTHYTMFDVPIWYKKLEMALPAGEVLNHSAHLVQDAPQKTTHDGYDFYRWEFNNVKKVENEEAILDNYDPYGTINLSTLTDWSPVVKWYQDKTYRKFEITYDVQEALDSIIKPGMKPQEKVDAVYNYLTREIKYSYVSFLQSGYIPKSPDQTLSARIGDCKDVATLMIAMLRALNIESYYALVKTNSFNHQDMLPSLAFDHVVACAIIDGEKRFYDLTTDFYPSFVLTENDIGAYSLLIKEGEKNLFLLPLDDLNEKKNKIQYTIQAQLSAAGTLDLQVNSEMTGITGGSWREYFAGGVSDLEKRNVLTSAMGSGNYQNLTLTDYSYENASAITEPLRGKFTFKAEEYTDEVVGLLICPIPWMNSLRSSPAISTPTRSNRLDVSQICNTDPMVQKVILKAPKGYKLMKVPQPVSVETTYGKYELKFKLLPDGSLQAEKFQQFKTRTITPQEFDAFKTYYLKILKLDRMKIAFQQL